MSVEPTNAVISFGAGDLKEVYSDIHMKYTSREGNIFFKIENQSDICNTMPVRDMGYKYAGYQQQIRQQMRQNEKAALFPKRYSQVLPDGQKLSPVITMVLNYNQKEWSKPTSLKQMLVIPERLREKLEPWLFDYPIHVINLAHQKEEVIEKYQSDFRMVVEYLANPKSFLLQRWMREKRKVRHPIELAELLYALSRDKRYKVLIERLSEENGKGDEIEMCELLDLLEERGMERASANLNALIQILTSEKRYDDLERSATDRDFQNQLMKEYQII